MGPKLTQAEEFTLGGGAKMFSPVTVCGIFASVVHGRIYWIKQHGSSLTQNVGML